VAEPQDDPAAAVRAQLAGWLDEVLGLRRQVRRACPARGSAPPLFHDAMLEARGCQDRVEEILGEAQALCGSARRAAEAAREQAEDSFDEASAALRRQAVRRDADYTTGREREADVNLQIRPQRARQRSLARIRDECDEAVTRIRDAYFGINGTRQDLGRSLGYFAWESTLDR